MTASGDAAGVRYGRTWPVHTCLHVGTSGTTYGMTGSWTALAWGMSRRRQFCTKSRYGMLGENRSHADFLLLMDT